MMPSTYLGVAHSGSPSVAYHNDGFLDDLSRQMAISQASRRLSRGSNGNQRPANAMTNAMRIVKPSSANNSPRSSVIAARRRTMMNDTTWGSRRQHNMGQPALSLSTTDMMSSRGSSSRPLSWHPSSYQQPMAHHMPQASVPTQPHPQSSYHVSLNQYPFPSTFDMADHESSIYQPHYSPTPGAYSCSTSPNSAFSPLVLPSSSHNVNSAFDSVTYLPVDGWALQQHSAPAYVASSNPSSGYSEPFPTLSTPDFPTASSTSSASTWSSYAAPQGFSSTSPPTPETLPQSQQPRPAVSSEEALPFEALDEPEEEGEILVGMGLYDAPEKCDEDPYLSNSRSAMSSLLGTPHRPQEATGKGLKLEEAWEPPESDEENDCEDGDGESQAGDDDYDVPNPKSEAVSVKA